MSNLIVEYMMMNYDMEEHSSMLTAHSHFRNPKINLELLKTVQFKIDF